VISSKSCHLICSSLQHLTLHLGIFPFCRMLCIYIYIYIYIHVYGWIIEALSFLSRCPLEFFQSFEKSQVAFTRRQSYVLYSFIMIWFSLVIIVIISLNPLSLCMLSAPWQGKYLALCKGSNFKISGYGQGVKVTSSIHSS